MSIRNYIIETKKKEISFGINGEKSVDEFLNRLKLVLKMCEKSNIISISGNINVAFVEEDTLDNDGGFVH